MKKFLLPILSVVLVIGMATIVWATVMGTPHELAPEPCAMCHTPHSGTGDYPLWNRYQEDAAYTPYESISFDMGPVDTIRNPSRLCLVCHNGVFSELVNYPGPCTNPDSAYDITVEGCANLTTDLMDDHPISFDYDDTKDLDDNGFPTAAGQRGVEGAYTRYAIEGLNGTLYWLYGEEGATNWFECATCHSVHDLGVYDGKGDYQVYFLRGDNTESNMCRDCHIKR